MNDREIEALDFLIVTDATFIENSLMLKDIRLTSLALAKAVEDRFGNRFQAISYCVETAVSFAHNLISIGAVAKIQSRMRFQNLATFAGFQRATHRIGQTLCG